MVEKSGGGSDRGDPFSHYHGRLGTIFTLKYAYQLAQNLEH